MQARKKNVTRLVMPKSKVCPFCKRGKLVKSEAFIRCHFCLRVYRMKIPKGYKR